MADVYRARVTGMRGFSKSVAIKKIHPHLLNQRSFLNMFIDEAKIASRLLHPNIAQIFELGEVNGQPFISMEYVSGQDLYEVVRRLKEIREPCPWPLAVRVILEVSKALHFAHEFKDADGQPLGIVHRDVSPRNILLSYSGDVKLTDFGVARARGREEKTQAGIIKGKIRYLSPEAARGEEIDQRSDIFSLGVIFSELLTMENFRQGANNLAILAAIRKGIDRERHFDALPKELERVLAKALALETEKRYSSSRDFYRELTALAVGPISPMSRHGLGKFLQRLFNREYEAEKSDESHIEKLLANWKHGDLGRQDAGEKARVPPGPPLPESKAILSGDLQETSLTRVLSNLLVNRRSGALVVKRPPVEKTIFFIDGEITDVRANVLSEMLGEFLVRRKKLTRDQLQRSLKLAHEENIQLTVILLREGLLSAGELFENLSTQLHCRVFDIFSWPDGDFSFYPGSAPKDMGQKLCLDTLDLILVGVTEYLPPVRILEKLKLGTRSRVQIKDGWDPAGFPLSGKMQGVLSALKDESRSFEELQVGEGEESLLRVLYLLHELDLIKILPG